MNRSIRAKCIRLLMWLRLCFKASPIPLLSHILSNTLTVYLHAIFVVWSGRLIDEIVLRFQGHTDANPLKTISIMLIIGLTVTVFGYVSSLSEKRLADDVECYLSERFLSIVGTTDYLLFEKREFKDKMDAARYVMEGSVTWMLMHFTQLISTIFGLIAYLSILRSALLSIIAIAAALCLVLTVSRSTRRFRDRHQARLALIERQRKLGYYESLLFSPAIAKEFHVFHLHDHVMDEWERMYDTLQDEHVAISHADANTDFFLSAVPVLLTVGLLTIAWSMGSIKSPGEFTVLLTAFSAIMMCMKDLGGAITSFYEATVYMELLEEFETYGRKDSIETSRSPRSEVACKGELAVEMYGVSFSYDDGKTYALRNIDLEIPKGQVIAIVGENGAGKTTLANVILGLYRPQSGVVYVDGHPAYGKQEGHRPRVVCVSQTFGRYGGLTLRENITFGLDREFSQIGHELLRWLERLELTSCVQELDSVVGNEFDGIGLSGGQWQRIALLRSFISGAEILIFDEPTASLDPLAEINVYNNLIEMHHGKTIFVITHRLGIARRADQIIVLRNGEIVQRGQHDSLMAQQGPYRDMYQSQAQWYMEDRTSNIGSEFVAQQC